MDFYVGNTDLSWFGYLRGLEPAPEDINFWKPSEVNFKAIPVGAPFLLKLKAPVNKIAGVGFFMGYTKLPLSMTWETFGQRNGCATFPEFRATIQRYRSRMGLPEDADPDMGCIALTDPVLFDDRDFIDAPMDWSSNIVSGKTYSTRAHIGAEIWGKVAATIAQYALQQSQPEVSEPQPFRASDDELPWGGYSGSYLGKTRIGQGAFRIMITNAYQKRCAVTGEALINVLDAAHIQDYAKEGPNQVSNGLLLRSDIHKLFDKGIMTITREHRIEISNDIRSEYENSSKYLALHGKPLENLPKNPQHLPLEKYLIWHNDNCFRR